MAKRINATDYLELNPTANIIDLRTPAEHEGERLHSGILLPVQDLTDAELKQTLTTHGQPDQAIYLLCQSGRRADMALDKLDSGQHSELIIIEGGLNALKAAGAKTIIGSKKTISLERQVRIAAGALTLLGVVLGFTLSSSFFALSAFVGAGLMFAGITDTCGMGMVLARMPWNKASS